MGARRRPVRKKNKVIIKESSQKIKKIPKSFIYDPRVHLFVGAFFQGLSIDVDIPFLKGAYLVVGTVLLINGWQNI